MRTKNTDLLEKLSRKIKSKNLGHRPNRRILGKSIDERPKTIDSRESFGHWQIDTVVGNKAKSDAVLLTLAERTTRFEIIMKLNGKDAQSVGQEGHELRE